MKVFSPLVEVQPITPSLDKLWDQHEGAKKDHLRVDKKPSLLFPSSNRRFPLSKEGGGSDHPIFDWKPSSTSKQGGVSQPPRIPSRPHTQQGSSFTLQLFQRTLEETLGAFQKSIHEDMRNLHIEILRQFHMQETRQAFTPEQINEACYVDINSNKAVFDSLRNNPKVNYDGRCFAYKSKHALKDKNQLLILIRKFPEGIAVIDLKDAYPTVMEDLQALKAAGQIWLLSNFDSQEDIAYPNDPRVPIKVDDDLKLLFRGIELPRDMIDIEKNLQKNGMKPATNTAKI
ncbi:uncharacterized protein LOC114263355 isoform X6 [Camellia sinensis]|uniref:uncharacterized protein LOC114263355 isoform X6 n=1 Tax=Camellia sinensis TaxID=4442 RepID=UPI001035B434|nr:uncharacterized protein LOC114263355 isoform X6 [Camellia sinensis]XP_028059673.1 uncharacterized protein LOC114263355 isoform X6 [Camellia sinensis]